MNKINLLTLLRLPSTVFTFKEILLISATDSPTLLKRRLNHYVQNGELYSMRRGLYAKDKNYDRLELATKIYTPSYISFETVLAEAGMIFQHYTMIFVATYQTKEIVCDGQTYSFRKIKDTVLTNTEGIEQRANYYIASKERAFLDVLYLNKNYYFDNLSPLDVDKVLALLPMYENQQLVKRVHKYLQVLKHEESK